MKSLCALALALARSLAATPTYNRDIASSLYENCVSCHRRSHPLRFICLLFALALAAALTAADPQEVKLLPDGAGKEAVVKACLECHGTANFRKSRKDPDEWTDSVQDMLDRGAKATSAEADVIVAYLVKNFGKGAKVQMNTAPLEEIKVVLGFTVPEANAIVAWRDQNGPYKDWRDVLKVAGVDPAKVESIKDSMAF